MCCPGISKDVQGRELWVSTEHCVQWWLFPANCKNNGCQRSETVTITTLSSFINTIIITNAVCYQIVKGFQGQNDPQTCRVHHVESFRMQSAQKQPEFGRSRECDCHKQWRADHTTKYHYCNLLSSSRDQISLLSFFRKTPNPFFFGLLVPLCSYSLFDDSENAKKGIDWLRYFICKLAWHIGITGLWLQVDQLVSQIIQFAKQVDRSRRWHSTTGVRLGLGGLTRNIYKRRFLSWRNLIGNHNCHNRSDE